MIIRYHVKNPARTQGYLKCNCGTMKKNTVRVIKSMKTKEYDLITVYCSKCHQILFSNIMTGSRK